MAPTPDRLLDSAEQLFAERGIDEVSLREITAAADANVAAVNYHYGSKEGLLLAVLERRMAQMASRRDDMLAELEYRPKPPTVQEVAGAFLYSIVALLHEDPTPGQSYITLLARVALSSIDIRTLSGGRDIPARYLALYRRARPDLPADVAERRVAITSATVLEVLGRPLNAGRPTPLLLNLTTSALIDEVTDFIVAGLSAPRSSSPRRPSTVRPHATPLASHGEAPDGVRRPRRRGSELHGNNTAQNKRKRPDPT